MAPAGKVAALLLLVGSVVLVVAATTMPWSIYYVGHSHWARVEWVPFSQRVRPLDFLLNILLFVPFGFSAGCLDASRTKHTSGGRAIADDSAAGSLARHRVLLVVVLAAILLSIGVELFQVYSHGRLPTTTDVLSNAIGALLGARLALHVVSRRRGA